MKGRINSGGALEIVRRGEYKKQWCPFSKYDTNCGDWCPLFREPKSAPAAYGNDRSSIFLAICKAGYYLEEFEDLRGKDETS